MSAIDADLFHRPPTQAGAALDLIFIEGLRGDTVIGIHDDEAQPQPLVLDVAAGVPHVPACDTDRIGDTIDYSVVRERLLRLMREHRVRLLEVFAEAMCDVLLDEFGAAWARVRVVKPRKFDDVDTVGVQIERWAGARGAAQGRRRGGSVLRLIGGDAPARRG
ncbi:MAG: dihydroneopterin aldolase [Ideonella sp.]|nr:dihydroneopterin aldolase [Ideonella sp.]MCC7458446.1 dihydroneopterin aldolase [Nitrospira sp.]